MFCKPTFTFLVDEASMQIVKTLNSLLDPVEIIRWLQPNTLEPAKVVHQFQGALFFFSFAVLYLHGSVFVLEQDPEKNCRYIAAYRMYEKISYEIFFLFVDE